MGGFEAVLMVWCGRVFLECGKDETFDDFGDGREEGDWAV